MQKILKISSILILSLKMVQATDYNESDDTNKNGELSKVSSEDNNTLIDPNKKKYGHHYFSPPKW